MSATPGQEVFSNYDYEFAAAEKLNPQKGLVQIMGERALKWAGVSAKRAGDWLKGMNEKRKAEKADRKYNGSLNELYAVGEQQQRQQTKEARPVADEPGLYRSNFSGEQPEAHVSEHDRDDIMEGAVSHARKALGQLPVLAMHQPEDMPQPTSQNPHKDERRMDDWTAADDEALIARLNRAYNRPAQEPDRSGHTLPETNDDDQLVGTQGK